MDTLKKRLRSICPNHIWYFLAFLKKIFAFNDAKNLKSIKFNKCKNEIAVLGNGPCLIEDIKYIDSSICDIICVNNFACSNFFSDVKPSKYVLIDEYFFSDNAHRDWILQREKTFKAINDSTCWEMQIFIPSNANKKVIQKVIKNPLIDIVNIRVGALDFGKDALNNFFYDTGFIGPHQVNVLVYAIYISIWSKYKDIKVYGANMSFHNDVKVNQDDNTLYMEFKHFNDTPHIENLMKNPGKVDPFTITELMDITTKTFRSHDILAAYANKKGCYIINKSSYSLIDAYPRNKTNLGVCSVER